MNRPRSTNEAFSRELATRCHYSFFTNIEKSWPGIFHYRFLRFTKCAATFFCTETLDGRNYWAELAEILYGPPKGGNSRLYRGVFGNSVWGPRCGVPREPQGRPKILKKNLFEYIMIRPTYAGGSTRPERTWIIGKSECA